MTIPSANEVLEQMKDAITTITRKDFPALGDFAQRQMEALADQAIWIGEAAQMGEFDGKPELRKHFLDTLDKMTMNFANVLTALLLITIEKIWNSLVKVLWDTIDKVAGFQLPRPII